MERRRTKNKTGVRYSYSTQFYFQLFSLPSLLAIGVCRHTHVLVELGSISTLHSIAATHVVCAGLLLLLLLLRSSQLRLSLGLRLEHTVHAIHQPLLGSLVSHGLLRLLVLLGLLLCLWLLALTCLAALATWLLLLLLLVVIVSVWSWGNAQVTHLVVGILLHLFGRALCCASVSVHGSPVLVKVRGGSRLSREGRTCWLWVRAIWAVHVVRTCRRHVRGSCILWSMVVHVILHTWRSIHVDWVHHSRVSLGGM